MTTATSHTFRALHVPADERASTSLYTESIPQLLRRCGIELIEIIRTQYLANVNAVMVMDDDSIKRQLPINRRAQFLSGYPIEHAIRGDVLFMGEEMAFDGLDLVSLPQDALDKYLQNSEVQEGYSAWLFSEPVMNFSVKYGLPLTGREKGLLSFN